MKPGVNEQTYVCSVVFLDIVKYSQQSNAVESEWRVELSALLDSGLEDMDPDDRVVVDTGDGAAIAFLLHPEEALAFLRYMRDALPGLRHFSLRVGAHLGPLRIVRGMNGHPNIVGDGINAAQRVMGFAGINEVLVSRAFQEAVIWLSPGNAALFSPYGKQADKHGREHDLYRMDLPREDRPDDAESPLAEVTPGPSSGFRIRAGLATLLVLLASVGAWAVLGERQAAEPAAVKAEPGPTTVNKAPEQASASGAAASDPTPQLTVTPEAPKVTESPIANPQQEAQPVAQGEVQAAAQEVPRANVIAARAKAATAKEKPGERAEYCPDCSCSDLLTKLSLGIPLDEKGRRYMNELCKK